MWIHKRQGWPEFRWDVATLSPLLVEITSPTRFIVRADG